MDIKVLDQKAEPALAVKQPAVNMKNLQAVMGEAYGLIMKKLEELGKEITGAPYVLYTNANPDYSVFDLEMGFPVAEELPVDGDLYMTKTYEGKAVEAIHKGPYDTLEETYVAMMKYIQENSLEATGETYDFYLNNPMETKPEELLTKVVMPVK